MNHYKGTDIRLPNSKFSVPKKGLSPFQRVDELCDQCCIFSKKIRHSKTLTTSCLATSNSCYQFFAYKIKRSTVWIRLFCNIWSRKKSESYFIANIHEVLTYLGVLKAPAAHRLRARGVRGDTASEQPVGQDVTPTTSCQSAPHQPTRQAQGAGVNHPADLAGRGVPQHRSCQHTIQSIISRAWTWW